MTIELITMAGLTYLILILMLAIQININRNDRKQHRFEVADLHCRLNASSITEYAHSVKILESQPETPVTKKERKELASFKYKEAKEDMDEFPVST